MGNIYEELKEYRRAYLCYEQAVYLCNDLEKKEILLNKKNELNNYKVPKVSFIILTYNQLEYTKVCIESIRKNVNPETYEIIIVDNNSTDDTVNWLKMQKDIKVRFNTENHGFPGGCNEGIEMANEENDIFLLNNDTVIMTNSVFNLRLGLYSSNKVGAVGAVSNNVSYYQNVNINYDNFNDYIKYAEKNNVPREESYEERVKLIGFAMLIKRKVINITGGLDERFSPGNFEDDDISFRIIKAGYKLLLCKDSYIHHFGSVSFSKKPKEYSDLLKINSEKFSDKWGFSSTYSTCIRFDVVDNIIEEKDKKFKILEIGSATGATLLNIKSRYKNAEIYGIDIDEGAIKICECFANAKVVNVETEEIPFNEGLFDYIIMPDVLEHLRNPEEVLGKVKRCLKDDGKIIISIPNVMHYSILADLINGNWTYADSGILDKTHVKFFTLNEIIKLLDKEEYKIEKVSGNKLFNEADGPYLKKLMELNSNKDVSIDQYKVYQYLLVCSKKEIYTKKRKNLIKVLRRLDFDCLNKDISSVIYEINNNKISNEDIINIIKSQIVNKVKVLNELAIGFFSSNNYENVIPFLKEALEIDKNNEDTLYNLGYVLNTFGEKDEAIKYLSRIENKNEEVKELISLIGV
ncbi:MAG: methyltransferase domain-containing protein [Clostridiales bacterium]|nr:methyltransferase domain-containing protein [Clostridiales bacterium]